MKSGKLIVYRDRTEFIFSSVQKATFYYANLIAVKKEWDHIDFITEDGHKESCPADRKCVHEAFLYIEQMVRPYLIQRENRLQSQGISGGITLFKSAARVAGGQTASDAEERLSCLGVAVTFRADQEEQEERIWFGLFPTGMSRANKKYE